jgi:hypothetical protein
MTSVQCLAKAKYNSGSLFIHYGTISYGAGQIVTVRKAIVHERYRHYMNHIEYDIALLQVWKPFVFNDLVKAIPLRKTMVPMGANVTIVGFGVPLTGELRYTETNLIECSNDFVRGICVSKDEFHGACFGDIGGPAIYENELIGIASYVDPKCNNTYAGNFNVYTSVHFFYKWITEKIVGDNRGHIYGQHHQEKYY